VAVLNLNLLLVVKKKKCFTIFFRRPMSPADEKMLAAKAGAFVFASQGIFWQDVQLWTTSMICDQSCYPSSFWLERSERSELRDNYYSLCSGLVCVCVCVHRNIFLCIFQFTGNSESEIVFFMKHLLCFDWANQGLLYNNNFFLITWHLLTMVFKLVSQTLKSSVDLIHQFWSHFLFLKNMPMHCPSIWLTTFNQTYLEMFNKVWLLVLLQTRSIT
jgi:hypothetical protein